jgi:hypothetical protein
MTNHEDLSQLLQAVEAEIDAAETHGILCGSLCHRAATFDWRTLAFGPGVMPPDELLEALDALAQDTIKQLQGEEFDFSPLLPSLDEPFERQLEALSDWCHGFLLGVSHGWKNKSSPWAPGSEAAEFIQDVLRIAEGVDAQADETNARALVEIVEYLRVGVQTLFDEARAA